MAQAGELLLDPIRRTIQERVHVMPVEQVEVVQSQLGDNAGVIGVACWAALYVGRRFILVPNHTDLVTVG